jgi:predicted cation transporter
VLRHHRQFLSEVPVERGRVMPAGRLRTTLGHWRRIRIGCGMALGT